MAGRTAAASRSSPSSRCARCSRATASSSRRPRRGFFARLPNQPDGGSLRTCVAIVEYATMLSEMRSHVALDAPVLKEALRCALTTRRAELLTHEMDERERSQQARVAKVG